MSRSDASVGELAAWIDLHNVPGIGPANFRALLSAFGLPNAVLDATYSQLCKIVPTAIATSILARDRDHAVETALAWIDLPGNRILTLADPDYPSRLLELADPPPVLFARGNTSLLDTPAIAIVGSRNATPAGVGHAEQFAKALSDRGFAIISGLALGIDAAAHRGGLGGRGSTVAVMGTGMDTLYPKRNATIANQIAEHGLLLSEFPLGTAPLPGNFPRRNRLIAALSRGVLVVEAALASGSLITARLAADLGRDVFAIPGSIHSPVSKGCHALIKQGAKLVESADDVLDETAGVVPDRQRKTHYQYGVDSVLLQHMGYDPCTISTLCERSGLTADAVSAMLLTLELEGRISVMSGGLYQRLA